MLRQDLSGKVAVVIGGSGNIGRAICVELAQAGAEVVVTYYSDDTVTDFVARLPGTGHAAMPACVESTASLEELALFVQARYGRADILVNSAGFSTSIAPEDLDLLTDELIDRSFAVNWRGPFAAIRVFRTLLATHGDGLVVNISSAAVQTGMDSNIAYRAAKAGVDVMTRALARALAPDIRVMAISPGRHRYRLRYGASQRLQPARREGHTTAARGHGAGCRRGGAGLRHPAALLDRFLRPDRWGQVAMIPRMSDHAVLSPAWLWSRGVP
jgi:3-oxoacyl-[acyl-carrier protein] reductase